MRLFFLFVATIAITTLHAQQPKQPHGIGLPQPAVPAWEPWPAMRFSRLMMPSADVGLPHAILQPMPKAWRFEDLALFCKIENRSDRFFPVPLRIRAGDVPYVDWLEGKRRNP